MNITDLAKTVRLRRREIGLTQNDLADLAGVSPRFLGDLERGKPTVRLEQVVAVLGALGLEFTVGVSSR